MLPTRKKHAGKKHAGKKQGGYCWFHLLLVTLPSVFPIVAEAKIPPINDLLELSLEELKQIQITVASPFRESDLVVGSTVALISEKEWQLAGARRTNDAIGHLPSTMVLPHVFGGEAIAIRGYAQLLSTRGLATLIDGVPVNSFASGTAQFSPANFGLATLSSIEMIRGPGSAIYGSDAFHGVYALNTFESHTDVNELGSRLGDNGYYQGFFRDSRQLNSSLRSNIAFSASGQGDQDRRYSYTDASGNTQSGSRDLNYGSQTGIIKLASDEEQLWSYRWGLYWDSYDAEQFPGFGRALSGSESALGATDWSGNDSRFAMTNLSIARILPNEISLEFNNFYWSNTTSWSYQRPLSLEGVSEVLSNQVNTRQGTELIFKQADNPWHTQWVASMGYNQQQVEEASNTNFAPDGSPLGKTQQAFSGLSRDIRDLFLQARTSLYDNKLQLLFGGRIDDYADFGVQRTPRMGVIVLPQPDLAFKLLYGEAFRAPDASELISNSITKTNPDLKPESSKSYEFTIMKHGYSGKTELTFFKNQWRDGITAIPSSDPNYSLEFANISKNNAWGLELSYQLVGSQWLANLSASYVRSENALTHTDYVAFPRVIVNAGLGYQLDNGLQLYLNNRFYTDVKAGPVTPDIPNPASLASYWRADFHMGKDLTPHLQLSLDIKNLFDRDNYLPSIASAEYGLRDEPFSASVGMRYNF